MFIDPFADFIFGQNALEVISYFAIFKNDGRREAINAEFSLQLFSMAIGLDLVKANGIIFVFFLKVRHEGFQ